MGDPAIVQVSGVYEQLDLPFIMSPNDHSKSSMAVVFQDGFIHLSDVSAAPNVAKMFFADVKDRP